MQPLGLVKINTTDDITSHYSALQKCSCIRIFVKISLSILEYWIPNALYYVCKYRSNLLTTVSSVMVNHVIINTSAHTFYVHYNIKQYQRFDFIIVFKVLITIS